MTEKQRERIEIKIKKIRSSLAAEKRKFGGFFDNRGMRYVPTGLYIKIGEFKGGLRYVNWFWKNFPDDAGFPEFLFETTMIYFKTGKIKDAEDFALKTYFSNTFLLDKYFDKPMSNVNKKVSSNLELPEYLQSFDYRHDHKEFLEFSHWLITFMQSERFTKTKIEFDELERQLANEPVGPRRSMLVKRISALKE